MSVGGTVEITGSSDVGEVVAQDLGNANDAMDKFESHGREAGKAADKAGGSIGDLVGQVKALEEAVAGSELLKLVGDLYEAGAAAERATNSLNNLSSGQADKYVQAVGDASLGTVDNLDAMTVSSRALQLGVVSSAEDMGKLTQAAIVLGREMNVGPTQALNDMVEGLAKASPRMLEHIGLVIKHADVQREANQLMSEDGSLTTEAANKEALYNLVMQQANETIQKTGGVTEDAASGTERWGAVLNNAKDAVGKFVADGLSPVLNGLLDTSQAMTQHREEVAHTAASYEDWQKEMVRSEMLVGDFGAALNAKFGKEDFSRDVYEGLKNIDHAAVDAGTAIAQTASAAEAAQLATAKHVTTVDELTTAFKKAGSAAEEYDRLLQQQDKIMLDLDQSVPKFLSSHAKSADVFSFGVKMLGDYNLGVDRTRQLYEELGLATGQLTQKQLDAAKSTQTLDNLFVAGDLSGAQYAKILQEIQKGADAAKVAQEAMAQATQSVQQHYNDAVTSMQGDDQNAAQSMGKTHTALQALDDKINQVKNDSSGGTDAALAKAQQDLSDYMDKLKTASEPVHTQFVADVGTAMGQIQPYLDEVALTNKTYDTNFSSNAGEAQGPVNTLKQAADAAAGDYVLNFDINTNGQIPSGPTPTAQPKASGGPIAPGQPYLVGEEGPELIIPDSASTVLTASDTAALTAAQPQTTGSATPASNVSIGSINLPNVLNAADFIPELKRELRNHGLSFAPLKAAA